MSSGQERRKHTRYPLVLPVHWQASTGAGRGQTEDLSAGGLFIRTDRLFTQGEQVGLELALPGLPDRIRLNVQVVRARKSGPAGAAGVGVELASVEQAEALRLEALARAASEVGHRCRPLRVLLVEDNGLVAAMYASALRRLSSREGLGGVEVETVGDGDRALHRLEERPGVDLVITDVYMPIMDGLELLGRIRRHPRLAALPVVVISSGNGDERERAVEMGAQFFLHKPVKYQDIVATIRTLFTVAGPVATG